MWHSLDTKLWLLERRRRLRHLPIWYVTILWSFGVMLSSYTKNLMPTFTSLSPSSPAQPRNVPQLWNHLRSWRELHGNNYNWCSCWFASDNHARWSVQPFATLCYLWFSGQWLPYCILQSKWVKNNWIEFLSRSSVWCANMSQFDETFFSQSSYCVFVHILKIPCAQIIVNSAPARGDGGDETWI